MPDREAVRRHLLALVSDISRLKKHTPCTPAQLQRNPDLLWILERGLYLCIQNLLDVFTHIIAADLNEQWDSYSDAAGVLQKHGVLSADQGQLLNKMIGLRNRLTHDYLTLDADILLDLVNSRLDDFLVFAEIVSEYCDISLPEAHGI